MPVDVTNVDGEDGEGRVPTGTSALIPVFLLNEDIGVADDDRVEHRFDRAARCLGGTFSSVIPASTLWPRSRCAYTTVPRPTRVHTEGSQLANFAFAIHFFAEYVTAIEYVSRNAFLDVHAFICHHL